MAIREACVPAIMRVSISWLMRGNTVLVRMASIMRPPLSSSEHRLATSFSTSSVYVNGSL